MKKIDYQFATALKEIRNWKGNNCEVRVLQSGDVAIGYLFGNHIVSYSRNGGTLGINTRGYNTVTTRNRLRVVLAIVAGYSLINEGDGVYRIESSREVQQAIYINMRSSDWWCINTSGKLAAAGSDMYRKPVLVVCPICGKKEDIRAMREDPDRRCICANCWDEAYVTCDCCGEVHRREDTYSVANGDVVCERCYDNEYFTCDECGYRYPNSSSYATNDDQRVCQSCYESLADSDDNDDDGEAVKSYGYTPEWIFYNDTSDSIGYQKGSMYMGMELEVSCNKSRYTNGSTAYLVQDCNPMEDQFCLKKDGSVPDGFEMATHPRTINSWRTFVRAGALHDVLQFMKEAGVEGQASGDTCRGIHIHSTREAWSKEAMIKLYRFMFDPCNSRYLTKISQRNRGQLGQYASLNAWKYVQEVEDMIKGGRYHDIPGLISRNHAINMAEDTIEFRLFNSNIRPERILKNLEFVQSVYDWLHEDTRPLCETQGGISLITLFNWEEHAAYVRAHSDQYPNLDAFLSEKHIAIPLETVSVASVEPVAAHTAA